MQYLYFVFFLTIISCTNSAELEKEKNVNEPISDSVRFGFKVFEFPDVSKNVLKITESWSVFNEFYKEATSIFELNLVPLQDKVQKTHVLLDSISKRIPDTLSSSPISSRLTVVDTKINVLKQEVNKDIIHSERIENAIFELNNSVKNLIVQLNEKFQKDTIDRLKIESENQEREKQKQYFDSIQKIELLDQHNN